MFFNLGTLAYNTFKNKILEVCNVKDTSHCQVPSHHLSQSLSFSGSQTSQQLAVKIIMAPEANYDILDRTFRNLLCYESP